MSTPRPKLIVRHPPQHHWLRNRSPLAIRGSHVKSNQKLEKRHEMEVEPKPAIGPCRTGDYLTQLQTTEAQRKQQLKNCMSRQPHSANALKVFFLARLPYRSQMALHQYSSGPGVQLCGVMGCNSSTRAGLTAAKVFVTTARLWLTISRDLSSAAMRSRAPSISCIWVQNL